VVASAQGATYHQCHEEGSVPPVQAPDFVRETRFSAVVDDCHLHDDRAPAVRTKRVNVGPPNHRMRDFSLADCVVRGTIVDRCDGRLAVDGHAEILRLTADEPDDEPSPEGGYWADLSSRSRRNRSSCSRRAGQSCGRPVASASTSGHAKSKK
jgi:hypothetical protein